MFRLAHLFASPTAQVLIEEGQDIVQINIEILDNPEWNPTLEFKIHLSDPAGCELGLYLRTARVKVIDRNRFPSDAYCEQIHPRRCKLFHRYTKH